MRAQTPIAHPLPTAPVQAPATAPRPIALPILPAAGTQPGRVTGGQDPALQLQVAALNAQITTQSAQLATLNAKLLAATPPIAYQPYTNTTGRIVMAHYVVSQNVGGVGHSTADTIAGYMAEMEEDVAMGIDGEVLDYGSTNPLSQYPGDIDLIYQAAHNLTPLLPTIPNPAGIKQFVLTECPDMSGGIPETPDSLKAVGTLFAKYAHDPATLTVQGRPVLTMYAGDGGGASVVGPVYNPMLADIRAGNDGYPAANVFFLPMWTDTAELAAVDAGGGAAFGSGSAPLGTQSALPGIEAAAAAVQATKTAEGIPRVFMQPLFVGRYSNVDGSHGDFYNEYGGDRSDDAEWQSAINTVKPQIVQILTGNDIEESAITNLTVGSTWQGLYNVNVHDFWQRQDGLHRGIQFNTEEFKTDHLPVLTTDALCIFNRTQTVAATNAAAAAFGGLSYVTGISGEPVGLQDEINTRVELTRTASIELSGVGPTQSVVEPAGVSHPVFFFTQAGTPVLTERVNGQVVRQVIGHPIAASAPLVNLLVASRVSVPGVSFTLSAPAPLPALTLDRVGLFSRSTRTANAAGAVGVQNLAAYDLTPASPALFAANSLNNPAGLGHLLDQSAAAGQDALAQYNGNAYIALYADPLGQATPMGFNTIGNTNCVYFVPAKPFPSGHVKVQADVVSVSGDPNADGDGGVALVSSAPAGGQYSGAGAVAYVAKYAGSWNLYLCWYDNLQNGTNSAAAALVGITPVNSLAPGERYTVSLEYNKATGLLAATATPSNQQP